MTLTEIQEKLTYTKYSKLYINIINNSINKVRNKLKKDNPNYTYYEEHHILPSVLYKEYSNLKIHKWNKVLLTAKEHFICHILIMKHYRKIKYTYGYKKMSRAINQMSSNKRYSSKLYESYKLNLSHSEETKKKMSVVRIGIVFTKEHKSNLSNSHKGLKLSQDTKDKMSIARKGKVSGMLGKTHSNETKDKISKYRTGQKASLESRKNMSLAQKGRIVTEEHRKNISLSKSGSKSSTAKKILIIDKNNNIIHRTYGNFKSVCEENNYPYQLFIKSYRNKEIITRTTKYKEYLGWSAMIQE